LDSAIVFRGNGGSNASVAVEVAAVVDVAKGLGVVVEGLKDVGVRIGGVVYRPQGLEDTGGIVIGEEASKSISVTGSQDAEAVDRGAGAAGIAPDAGFVTVALQGFAGGAKGADLAVDGDGGTGERTALNAESGGTGGSAVDSDGLPGGRGGFTDDSGDGALGDDAGAGGCVAIYRLEEVVARLIGVVD
jgi:hypothetical protein